MCKYEITCMRICRLLIGILTVINYVLDARESTKTRTM